MQAPTAVQTIYTTQPPTSQAHPCALNSNTDSSSDHLHTLHTAPPLCTQQPLLPTPSSQINPLLSAAAYAGAAGHLHVHTPHTHARTAHGTPARLAPAASYAPHLRCLTCYHSATNTCNSHSRLSTRQRLDMDHAEPWLSRCRGCCLGCRAL